MNAVTQELAELKSREGVAAILQSVQIDGKVDGLLLNMSTRQHYKNTGAANLEAVYTFPLPWGATLLGLKAEIDGHRLQGTVMEKKEATQRYEKAIDEGDTPIMVERSASGLYSANLGNLKPGESAVIEIEYAQLLRFEQGQVRITVPTTVAPRYGDAHKTGGLAAHESMESSLIAQYPLTVKIMLTGEIALAAVQCPSHAVALARHDDALIVTLEQGGFLDRDFVLLLQGLQGQSFASMAPDGDGFAVQASFCPTLADQPREPLLLKVLVDCSGSMGGDSISAARKALHEVLQELDDQDWISYSRFGSTVVHDLPELVPCKPGNIRRVAKFIFNTEAVLGGTEMNAALISTFNQSTGPDWQQLFGARTTAARHQDVLLITDGDIWDVDAVIQSAKESGHRVFAIGVGSAPSESLLREVAEKTGGACELVSPSQSVAEVILRMFRRLRSPRCSSVVVDWGQPVLWQSALPSALYGGDTLHLFARMANEPVATPILSWFANDTAMQANASQHQSSAEPLLPRLVAAHQITELERAKESQAQSLELALRYQLVTNQTNLILVHVRAEDQKAEGLPSLEKVAHMQAAGGGGVGSLTTDGQTVQYISRLIGNKGASSTVANYDSMSTPSVWRSSNRAVAASKIDTTAAGGMDAFEIPAFLRKQADDNAPSSIAGSLSQTLRHTPRVIDLGPITTPLEILHAFDLVAGKLLASNRFVSALQALHIPVEVGNLLDEFTVALGSGAKAWAVVIQWLSGNLADQFTLSRQGERLLRHTLKDESAVIVDALIQQLTVTVGAVQIAKWHQLQVQV